MDTDGERQQQHGEAGETAEQQLPAAQQQQDAQQLQQQHAQQQGASEAGTAADEDDAAAALAAVADAAAEEPAGARRGASEEPAEGRRFPGFPMPGEAGAMPYPYPYHMYHQAYGYYQPYMYGPPPAGVPGQPPLPKQRSGGAPGELQLLQSGGSGGLDLTVRGSNRAFTGAARGAGGAAAVAAAVAADGQEQVNILNLPLPEVELQVGGWLAGWAGCPGVKPAWDDAGLPACLPAWTVPFLCCLPTRPPPDTCCPSRTSFPCALPPRRARWWPAVTAACRRAAWLPGSSRKLRRR